MSPLRRDALRHAAGFLGGAATAASLPAAASAQLTPHQASGFAEVASAAAEEVSDRRWQQHEREFPHLTGDELLEVMAVAIRGHEERAHGAEAAGRLYDAVEGLLGDALRPLLARIEALERRLE